jgi:cell division protein FtsL
MKPVTLIFVILVMMIAFGFLLSENFKSRQEAMSLAQRVDELQNQLAQMEADLGSCRNQSAEDAQTMYQQQIEIDELKADNKEKDGEISRLNTQVALLQSKQDLLDIFNENPGILAGALLTQLAAAAMKFNKKLNFIKWPTQTTKETDEEYIKLSREEVQGVIATRRNKTHK